MKCQLPFCHSKLVIFRPSKKCEILEKDSSFEQSASRSPEASRSETSFRVAAVKTLGNSRVVVAGVGVVLSMCVSVCGVVSISTSR